MTGERKEKRGRSRLFFKKHYKVMAAVVSSISSPRCQKDIAEKMCVAFATDSDDFNKEVFLKAAVGKGEIGQPPA